MSLLAKVGSFNIDTTKTVGQVQSVTGVGFTPKIIFFWWGGSAGTGDSVAGGDINIGFGAAVDSTHRWMVDCWSDDGGSSSDSYKSMQNTEVLMHYTSAASQDGYFDFRSMDADGFSFDVENQYSVAYRISYLALGGDDLTNVYVGAKQRDADTGNCAVTGVGFSPDAVIFASALFTSVAASTNSAFLTLGMATGSSNQGVMTGYTADNSPTMNTVGYGYNGEVIARSTSVGVCDLRDAFVSMDADGFTLNQLEGTTQFYYYFAALKGGQYLVSDLTTRTDGNDIVETVGFQPVATMFMSANRALDTQDTSTDHNRMSIGAATSASERACAAISDEDNVADGETAYANYDSAVYAHVVDDAAVGLMDYKSVESDGFTSVMDDADPAGCWVMYLAIGSAETGATLTVADAYCISQVDAPALTQVHVLSVADAACTSQADAPVVTKQSTLVVADAACTSQVDAVALNTSATLVLADAASTTQADNIGLTQAHNLSVADAYSTSQVDAVSLAGTATLTVADAACTTQVDAPVITKQSTLIVADTVCTTQVDSVTLTGAGDLIIADAACTSQADNVSLAQLHNLTVTDAACTTQADTINLGSAVTLVVQDTACTSQVDALAVVQTHSLSITDAYVLSIGDIPALTQVHVLVLADASVVVVTDNVILISAIEFMPVTIEGVLAQATITATLAQASIEAELETYSITGSLIP